MQKRPTDISIVFSALCRRAGSFIDEDWIRLETQLPLGRLRMALRHLADYRACCVIESGSRPLFMATPGHDRRKWVVDEIVYPIRRRRLKVRR